MLLFNCVGLQVLLRARLLPFIIGIWGAFIASSDTHEHTILRVLLSSS